MKKTHTDPETGWLVTREPLKKATDGTALVSESITNPKTGETHTTLRATDAPPRNVADWINQIARDQESANRAEAQ